MGKKKKKKRKKNRVRRPEGGILMPYHLMSIGFTNSLKVTNLLPSKRKQGFLLAWQEGSQWETVTTQPMKSHYTLNFQIPPIDYLFITFPHLLYKRLFLSLFCSPDFPVVHHWRHVLNCNSSPFPNKLKKKKNWLFYCFMVTTQHKQYHSLK